MPAFVPSFIAKHSRAKQHLVDLQVEIERFADKHPYTVRESVEGKKQRKVWRIVFTEDPANTDIPILAADVIYNLRSSLDHLMSSLVAPKDRGSAMFPIFFQGVWEAIVPGEDQQRVKERARWASEVKTIPNGAVAILKSLQPADAAWQEGEGEPLRIINRLSNRDRHENCRSSVTDSASFRSCTGSPTTPTGSIPGSIRDRMTCSRTKQHSLISPRTQWTWRSRARQ